MRDPLAIIFAVTSIGAMLWLFWPRRKPSPARHRMQNADPRTWMPQWVREHYESPN
jgi:hypothetical protein